MGLCRVQGCKPLEFDSFCVGPTKGLLQTEDPRDFLKINKSLLLNCREPSISGPQKLGKIIASQKIEVTTSPKSHLSTHCRGSGILQVELSETL